MEHTVYNYSLCMALALMLFFAFDFLIGKAPAKTIYNNYLRSRRIMGVAILVLSLNYAVHLFIGIRFISHNAAILMNLSTYFCCYWLFSTSLTALLDRKYITRRHVITHLSLWLLFTTLAGCVLLFIPKGNTQNVGIVIMAVSLFVYGILLARKLLLTYHKAIRSSEDIYSDDIKIYVNWMSVITYWAVIYGISCGLLTFLPDDWVFGWILSSIPFYIYLYRSFYNYLMFYEQVERAIEIDEVQDNPEQTVQEQPNDKLPHYHESIAPKLTLWVEQEAFTQTGFTIQELAKTLQTNRTYLNEYIKNTYHVSFREWVTGLRLEFAKKLMKKHPEMPLQKVAEASCFLSLSYFIKIFSEKEGCTPAKWKKQ